MRTFVIADNCISIDVSDSLAAWQEIAPRYCIFESHAAQAPMLEISIKAGSLSECANNNVYEPDHLGIGFIMACASKAKDGSIVMEFKHVEENAPRLRMTMPAEMDKADIAIAPAGDECDSYFLTHSLMLAYMLGTMRTGTLLIHASAVIVDGKAYLFQGKSGTGKSTHASLWVKNIPEAELLNDDNPVIRFTPDGVATAYGSPWSGKTRCYRNLSAPIGAIIRIVRAPYNELRRLVPLLSYASLTPSIFSVPFLSDELWAERHRSVERLVASVPCCEMCCLPNPDAALTCRHGLQEI